MKILFDTHLLLWAAAGSRRLPKRAGRLLENPETEPFFSAASVWEVAIKSGLGRKDFQPDAGLFRRGLLDNGYTELTITSAHAVAAGALPAIHRDPFDRMLIAQSKVEGIVLITADPVVAEYPAPVELVLG